MKNKKGFTLAELLGVIIILGTIAIIAFPPIINQIRKARKTIDETFLNTIKIASEQYLMERNLTKVGNYCISLNVLVLDKKLETPIINSSGEEISSGYIFYIDYNSGESQLVENDEDLICIKTIYNLDNVSKIEPLYVDLNNDYLVNETDVNLLENYINNRATSLTEETADINNDGSANNADLASLMSASANTLEVVSSKAFICKDFNSDNAIDANDLESLQNSIISNEYDEIYDLNNDGSVNSIDYALFSACQREMQKFSNTLVCKDSNADSLINNTDLTNVKESIMSSTNNADLNGDTVTNYLDLGVMKMCLLKNLTVDTVTICKDVNLDGKINLVDKNIIGENIDSYTYNQNADIDNNGYVNANDLLLIDRCMYINPFYGDINEDGLINASDLLSLKKYVAGYNLNINLYNADLNIDNYIDINDIVILYKYLNNEVDIPYIDTDFLNVASFGDMNNDGNLNSSDVNALRTNISSGKYIASNDLNIDGTLNTKDINILENAIKNLKKLPLKYNFS
jgi:type II secretory pathway pseudopilin PulG